MAGGKWPLSAGCFSAIVPTDGTHRSASPIGGYQMPIACGTGKSQMDIAGIQLS
jgi:hypothetical protein